MRAPDHSPHPDLVAVPEPEIETAPAPEPVTPPEPTALDSAIEVIAAAGFSDRLTETAQHAHNRIVDALQGEHVLVCIAALEVVKAQYVSRLVSG